MGDSRDDRAASDGAAPGEGCAAADAHLQEIYRELRALAAHYMRDERRGHTLQPTALVHEAYLRLAGLRRMQLQDREHFFAMAAREMRRVLVDHARRRGAGKRGGGQERVTLTDEAGLTGSRVIDMLALDQALTRLEQENPRRGRVAELRVFVGLQIDEISRALGITPRAAKEDWRMARAWLGRELA